MRKIIHVDMDAFYASVEQRDDPALRGRPVAVGGSSRRGVVMAASYEARVFGVRSALPAVTAKRRCPELIFIKPRFDVYREVSREIRAIFLAYTDLVEPLSLDEAYLDVSAPRRAAASATEIARAIKAEIREVTNLTASAGVSFNKFLAKVASGFEKPDGLTVIRPEAAPAFLDALPIEKFHGVGPATARKMHALGIKTGADLRARTEAELERRFGKAGRYYFRIVRGENTREVRPDRPSKSIGAERTFGEDVADPAAMIELLAPIADKVAERVTRSGLAGRTVTLKIKHFDFTIQTRGHTLDGPIGPGKALLEIAAWLLNTPAPPDKPVRLLGITVSNFTAAEPGAPVQLRLGFAT